MAFAFFVLFMIIDIDVWMAASGEVF